MGIFDTDEYYEDSEGHLHRKPRVGRPPKSASSSSTDDDLSRQQDSRMGTKRYDENGNQIYSRLCPSCHREVEFTRGNKPEHCPHCGEVYWDKPRDEYLLFKAQEKWEKAGARVDQLGILYPMLLSYSETLVKASLRGRVVLQEEDIHDKASDMALRLISYYQRNPETYRVRSSFGGLLSKIRLEVMYSNSSRYEDSTLSLDYEIGENTTLMDSPFLNGLNTDPTIDNSRYEVDAMREYETIQSEDTSNIVDKIISESVDEVRRSSRPSEKFRPYLLLVGVRNMLRRFRQSDMNNLYDYYGDTVRSDTEELMYTIHEYLLESVR